MPLLSLARPVENAASSEEARVLALVDHLTPLLDAWREGRDLSDEARRVDQQLAEHREQVAATRRQVEDAARWARETQAPLNAFGFAAIGLAALGLVSLIVPYGRGLIAALGFAAAIAAGIFWLTRRNQVRAIQAEKSRLEIDLADLDAAIQSLETRQGTVQAEKVRRSSAFPSVNLADIRFGIRVADVAGHKLIIDESGAHADVLLKTVDVSGLQNGVASISSEISNLLTVPPLLSAAKASAALEPIERLYGEETELSDLVTEFTRNLGMLRDVELRLPLIAGNSIAARRIAAGQISPAGDGPAIMAIDAAPSPAEIDAFVAEVDRARRDGQRTFANLREAYRLLDRGCQLYSTARSNSINELHGHLLEVLQRATWCSRRFYCARTIMSPVYLEDLLGIAPDQAYRLDPDDLVERLRRDDAIDQRLNVKPELESQLREAHVSVQEFMGDVGAGDNSSVSPARPRHVEDQFRECLQSFRRTLQRVMTGSVFPVLSFSAEAILHFDPEAEEWSSGLTPYVYRTHEVMRYGGVVKAHSDLMIPLWEHLWTEKADFRKAETFRTNDQLIRMSEKEAEKLIDIANQFRNDLRTVRENLHLLGADLKSKATEIVNFKDGMASLGLLSEHAREAIDRNSCELNEGEAEAIAGADRYETILAAQPQAQMESRGTVQDPIELVRGLDALLSHRAAAGPRLLSN